MLPSFTDLDRDFHLFDTYWKRVAGINEAHIKEDSDSFKIALKVPGISKENLKLSVENSILKVEGFSEDWFCDRTYRKEFSLGKEVDIERITSKLENGILNILLPKLEKAKKRVVEIKIE